MNPPKPFTVYARKEPAQRTKLEQFQSTDPALLRDVVIYRDKKATDVFCRIPWHRAKQPDRRNKYITLNCFRWNLAWLNP